MFALRGRRKKSDNQGWIPGVKRRAGRSGRARTSLAEEGELLVAVLGVPAVQPSLVHAFDLEALQLGAEDVVLAGRRLPQVGETLRGKEDLHGACTGGSRNMKQ